MAVEDGRIAAVGPDLDEQADELDASGLHVLPGVVDAHVHFNEPGRADWEGIATGSAAVAAGGGTCFVEMPLNAHPPTVDGDAFHAKLAAMERSSVVDFALWGGLVPGNAARLAELAALGVVGFKAFMAPSGIDDFEAADEETLREGMARAAELGLPVAVHAESPARLLPPAGRHVDATGPAAVRSRRSWRRSSSRSRSPPRPAARSTSSTSRPPAASGSSPRRAPRGVDASCETCPHYLFFAEEDARGARRARQVRAADPPGLPSATPCAPRSPASTSSRATTRRRRPR